MMGWKIPTGRPRKVMGKKKTELAAVRDSNAELKSRLQSCAARQIIDLALGAAHDSSDEAEQKGL